MIQITRAQAKHLRAVLRKAAPLGSPRTNRPPLSLHTDEYGLRVRVHYPEVDVEWHSPGPLPPDEIVVPGDALADFENGKDNAVQLTVQGPDAVQARWDDSGAPQRRDYVTVALGQVPPFPNEPKRFVSLDGRILKALDDGAQTAARTSTRLGVTRLQLRGKTGEVVSTDASQLLLQRGFPFPWKDDVLIPSLGVFGCRELDNDSPIAIGRTDKHVCIRIGSWKFHLEIDQHARYPRIEQAIPAFVGNSTVLRIASDDAGFLINALPRLPGREEDRQRITIDLADRVVIRARNEEDSPCTELLLARSEAIGKPVRLVCDRQFLARALRFGFTEVHVTKPDVPIVARDKQRLYVWVPLDPKSAILPGKDATRIASTVNHVPANELQTPRSKAMPAPQPNDHSTRNTAETNAGRRNLSIVDLIAEADELRTVVLDASARLSRLLSGLKQHRRQSRAVQAAMQSLKQLKLDS